MDNVSGYTPFQRIPEDLKQNSSLPAELRKLLNKNVPEPQANDHPMVDEESASHSHLFELVDHYAKAKWDHFQDSKVRQTSLSFKDFEERK